MVAGKTEISRGLCNGPLPRDLIPGESGALSNGRSSGFESPES
jgi:hypothetical protein